MVAPYDNMGMAYETDEKHITNDQEYFFGAVNTFTTSGVLI